MSGDPTVATTGDLNAAFLKSKRGLLKLAELVTLFAAFVCFAAASRAAYISATVMEFLITLLLVLLYLLKLNKRLTFFFWPLVDLSNSLFAAVYFAVLSITAVRVYTATSTLVGGVFGFLLSALLCADAHALLRNITLNAPRSQTRDPDQEGTT